VSGSAAPATGALPLPQRPVAILLDFDGVIVESVPLKIQAYLDIYRDEPADKLEQIRAHQREHGGVTRRLKFEYFEREVFKRPASAADLDRLAADYASRVVGGVLACPLVAGALDFLEATYRRTALHLVSGTPHGELHDIVAQRGLARYFRSVVGAPTKKRDAFAAILAAAGHPPESVVAIGDAITEFDAARSLGVAFLGISDAPESPFPPGVPVLPTMEGAAARLGFD
jgi:beta-phosphoglucomutase-like phosphatase (HAD superfamily)